MNVQCTYYYSIDWVTYSYSFVMDVPISFRFLELKLAKYYNICRVFITLHAALPALCDFVGHTRLLLFPLYQRWRLSMRTKNYNNNYCYNVCVCVVEEKL